GYCSPVPAPWKTGAIWSRRTTSGRSTAAGSVATPPSSIRTANGPQCWPRAKDMSRPVSIWTSSIRPGGRSPTCTTCVASTHPPTDSTTDSTRPRTGDSPMSNLAAMDLVELFRQELELCKVTEGEQLVILAEPSSRSEYVEAAFAAALALRAK